MKKFMDRDFLLDSDTAKHLFHDYAENMPIADYHCHLSPKEIYEDRRFENITQVWLGGDHYKWRLMRWHGVEEKYITGAGSDHDKFMKWAETLGCAIGNPLYHWSHLELQRYFGYTGILNEDTAEEVWNLCNEKLQHMSARQMIADAKVTHLCTTDDPIDDLHYHELIKTDSSFHTEVLPAWRPDQIIAIEKDSFVSYLHKLEAAAQMTIETYPELRQALHNRLNYFAAHGCRVSDHGLDAVAYIPASEAELNAILAKKINHEVLSEEECLKYRSALLKDLGREYAERGWVMQLHYNVIRNTNTRMFQALGPDSGLDCISHQADTNGLVAFLDALAKDSNLPKTVIYSLNPNDNAVIDTIIGCFEDSECRGKLQHGAAWWFNDHKQGMEAQMITLASEGMLSDFIGMLTDSRSFLSYARHEYFRRILCNMIGAWVENGEYPDDEKRLEKIVKGICYDNAMSYFGFDS